MKTFYLILSLTVFTVVTYSDDSGAEITPKGLQFKKIKEISIESEYLFISTNKIEVSMTFMNHSDKEISTVVAFPIPEYEYQFDKGIPNFNDFTVEVNGKALKYRTEVRAYSNGKDYTDLLQNLNISIQNFGKFDPSDSSTYYFLNLSKSNQKLLLNAGLTNPSDSIWPNWSVKIRYYWEQIFPAHSSVTIKHKYEPICGYRYFNLEDYEVREEFVEEMKKGVAEDKSILQKDACLSKQNLKLLISKNSPEMGLTPATWVSYVLKSALNWKQPIKKFHLVVEKSNNSILSTCYQKYLKSISPTKYEAILTDFVPSEDIKIYYFSLAR